MKFSRYNSIDNSYRIKTVHHILEACGNGPYVVQEKVHGSNFALYTDGETVRYGKRSGLLNDEENFQNYKTLPLEQLEQSAKALFFYLQSNMRIDVTQVSIHGEICGGDYPHPDVPKVQGVSRVQKEVKYSPKIEFLAFDIKANDEFVNMDTFIETCEKFNIPHLPLLKLGTLEECLKYPNDFESKVPAMLGLPVVEDNITEGTVVKPLITGRMGNGSRAVLKNKNEKFAEKSKTLKAVKQKDPLPQHVLDMMSVAGSYVTENRLKNVLSHIGEVQQSEFGKVLGLVSKDAIADFIKENPKFEEMEQKERKEITRYLNGQIGNMLRPNFRNIVDGNYA